MFYSGFLQLFKIRFYLLIFSYFCQNKKIVLKKKSLIILILSLLLCNQGFGQEKEVSESAKHKEAHGPDSAFITYSRIDESATLAKFVINRELDFFEEYRVTNNFNDFYLQLGNNGLATSRLTLPFENSFGWRFRKDVFSVYRLNPDSVKIYNSATPYANAHYIIGAAREQLLNFEINTKLGNGIHTGVHLRYLNAPGKYKRQHAHYPGGSFFATFMPDNLNYGAILVFVQDKGSIAENGGIQNVDAFLNNTESNRKTYLINLENADNISTAQNIVFQHFYKFGKRNIVNDTTTTDNSTNYKAKLVHTFKYRKEKSHFIDKSSNFEFYPQIFSDSLNIFDTVFVQTIDNSIAFTNFNDSENKPNFQYHFGVQNSLNLLFNGEEILNFNDFITNVKLKYFISKSANVSFSGKYILGKYNNNDFFTSVDFLHNFENHTYINTGLTVAKTHTDYFNSNLYNSVFRWNNDFSPISNYNVFIKYGKVDNLSISTKYSYIGNYVYLSKNITPVQHSNVINYGSIEFLKNFTLRHWKLSLNLITQKTFPDTVISLPVFLGKARLVYDRILFNKSLHAQIGATLTYHTKWKPVSYMPALKDFYIQDEFSAGNYPYVDLFVNFAIKRVRIFLKYSHINSYFSGYNYIMSPKYPLEDGGFNFGISWMFFD